MEITQETDYAVRCVLYLSRGRQGETVMIDRIAADMKIPRSFLAKILQKLAKGGIVTSFRGVKGGFMLAKLPAEISLLDVVEAIEGPVSMNRCTIDNNSRGGSSKPSARPIKRQYSY